MRFSKTIRDAIVDYYGLIEKGYPDKRTLELVADRYGLKQEGRSVLFRGVSLQTVNDRRQAKLIGRLPESAGLLRVDGINQLYILAAYLSGKLVYVASDGYLRDASEVHGKGISSDVLTRAVQMMTRYLGQFSSMQVEIFLDSQLNDSVLVEQLLQEYRGMGNQTARKSHQVDQMLCDPGECVVSTSDATIIDRTEHAIFDLARAILVQNFSAVFPEIGPIVSEKL